MNWNRLRKHQGDQFVLYIRCSLFYFTCTYILDNISHIYNTSHIHTYNSSHIQQWTHSNIYTSHIHTYTTLHTKKQQVQVQQIV